MLPPPGRRQGPPDPPPPDPQPPDPQPQADPAPDLPAVRVTRGKGNSHRMTPRPPQGAMTPAQRKVTPAEEAAFAAMEAEMGGRQRLVSVLATAQLPKDLSLVLGMIADPLHDHESLAKVCALGNVSLGKLMKVFQEAIRARGQLLATSRIAEHLPDVAAAVMADATPGWKTCLDCMETGRILAVVPEIGEDGKPTGRKVEQEIACPACRGRGLVWHQPDHEVQKTALKLGGILDTGKGGGMSLQILQQNTQVNPGDTGNFDSMMEALDAAIYGTGRDRLARTSADQDEEWVDGDVAGDNGADGTPAGD